MSNVCNFTHYILIVNNASTSIGTMSLDNGVKQSTVLGTNATLVYGAADIA